LADGWDLLILRAEGFKQLLVLDIFIVFLVHENVSSTAEILYIRVHKSHIVVNHYRLEILDWELSLATIRNISILELFHKNVDHSFTSLLNLGLKSIEYCVGRLLREDDAGEIIL
jgi:hypothetical protein